MLHVVGEHRQPVHLPQFLVMHFSGKESVQATETQFVARQVGAARVTTHWRHFLAGDTRSRLTM